ncbi:uncharacterized protein BX664DRAFT_372361 [Halteromyces radiatus]|uniref:uncharacterized protein n=1 Tax=Halteromyces radiatus TaxID=101107 RepID=UPI00221E89F1|nr:uncharacterized protein BX664DRAFT_372361 [Halteromyces radiatus]KAI8093481.1 hypothetical protein BX664DRAFT_372361 [Halteromyces radiatus]
MMASPKQRKFALISTIVGTSFLGFLFGPMSFLVISGLLGGVAWRIWRQTTEWWKYLPSNLMNNHSLYSMIRSQVGQHRAEDQVRDQTIQRIREWGKTDQGRRILLDDFNVDHIDQLIFLPTHSHATYTLVESINANQFTQKQVDIQFLIEESQDMGGCMVSAKAWIDSDTGKVTLKDIKLSSPDWSLDKHVPLKQNNNNNDRVIEGEFKDIF